MGVGLALRNKKALHEKATQFLGYGDPRHAKIWFVGLEAATPFGSLEELKRSCDQAYVTMAGCQSAKPAVYTVISKLIMALCGDATEAAWRTYRSEELFSAGSEAFLTNLYPLGKPIEKAWPAKYQRWLGVESAEYYKLLQTEVVPRFSFLRAERAAYKPALTVCFGKKHWKHFARCFALEQATYEDIGRFRLYTKDRLLMTEFFRSTRVSDDSISKLVECINAARLNPCRIVG